MYVRDFVELDIASHNITVIFLVDEKNNRYIAEYSADYYQSSLSEDEIGDIGNIEQIDPSNKDQLYYFEKVKINNADEFVIDIT